MFVACARADAAASAAATATATATGRALPDRFRGPAWRGWEAVFEPTTIEWRAGGDGEQEVVVGGKPVGWLEPRPPHCDRGRVLVNIELPHMDGADCFPRLYMSEAVAKSETEAFLRWRLWRLS